MRWMVAPSVVAALVVATACDGDGYGGDDSPGATATAAPEATAAPTEPGSGVAPGWQTYRDETLGFAIDYPTEARVTDDPGATGVPPFRDFGDAAGINLPEAEGTTLVDKYMLISQGVSMDGCPSSDIAESGLVADSVQYNGIEFLRIGNTGAAAGNIWDVTTYATERDGTCAILDAVLHSINPGAVAGPTPPPFDREAEAAVFEDILSTFRWLD